MRLKAMNLFAAVMLMNALSVEPALAYTGLPLLTTGDKVVNDGGVVISYY